MWSTPQSLRNGPPLLNVRADALSFRVFRQIDNVIEMNVQRNDGRMGEGGMARYQTP